MRHATIAAAFRRWLLGRPGLWPNDADRRELMAAYRAGYREAQRRHLDAQIEAAKQRTGETTK